MLARVLYGLRVSILFGLGLTLAGSALGIMVGAVQGYYGGWVDNVLMRITEAFQTLPNFVLLLVLVAVFALQPQGSARIGKLFGHSKSFENFTTACCLTDQKINIFNMR